MHTVQDLYSVPQGIDDDEIQAMISDGAPKSYQRGALVARIVNDNDQETAKLLDSTAVVEAVNGEEVQKQQLLVQ